VVDCLVGIILLLSGTALKILKFRSSTSNDSLIDIIEATFPDL
jgi:hypothetical protein